MKQTNISVLVVGLGIVIGATATLAGVHVAKSRAFDCFDGPDRTRPITCYGCTIKASSAALAATPDEQHAVDLRDAEERYNRKLEKVTSEYKHQLQLQQQETVRYRDLYVREKEQNKRPNEWLATFRTLAFCVLATAGIWRFGWAVNYVAAMSLRPKERNDARAQQRDDAPLVQEPPAMLPGGAAAVVEDVSNLDVAGELIACARNARAGATRKKEVRELLQSHGKMDSATLNAVYERVRTKALLEACTAADIAELL